MLRALTDLGQRRIGLAALLAQRLEPHAAGPDVVELAAAPESQPVEKLPQARGVDLHRRAQSVCGERPRLESATTLSRLLARRDVAGEPPLGVFEPGTQHRAPLHEARHLDLEVPAQHRHVRPAFLESPASLVGGGQPARRRGGVGFELGQALAQGLELRPVTLEAFGQCGPVPIGLGPLLAHQLELGLDAGAGRLQALALVLGPLRLPDEVVGLGHRGDGALTGLVGEARRSPGCLCSHLGLDGRLAGEGGQRVRSGPHHPPGRGEAVALGAHHRQVGPLEGDLDGPRPVTAYPHHALQQPVEDAGDGGQSGTHVAPHGLGTVDGPSLERPGAGRGLGARRCGEHGPHHVLVVEQGERGARRGGALHDNGAQRRPDRRLEGCHPAVVDIDEVLQDSEDAGGLTEDVRAGPGAFIGHLSGQRLGARFESVTLPLGAPQHVLAVALGTLGIVGDPTAILDAPCQSRQGSS